MNKTEFNPLSWSILFFSMWFTLKTIDTDFNPGFRWFLFVISILLLVSIYWNWLYKILSHERSVKMVLPTIFIVTIASFIISVIQSLGDLSTTEQYISLTISFVLLGTYITILISRFTKLGVRIVCSSALLVAFIVKLVLSGIIGSWPLLLIFVQSVWAIIQPSKFNTIPLV